MNQAAWKHPILQDISAAPSSDLESAAAPPGGARAGGGYASALTVLAGVFFMWGFATVLNDILVPHLKAVFRLGYGQSLLIQFVFYLGYLLMALPAAKLLERIGYKSALIVGLLGMALGAVCFVPAAAWVSFGFFLGALFLLASAITLLQVAANPYVTLIGAPRTASSRLNLVQAFNSAGTTLAPLFGGVLILGRSLSGTTTGAAAALSARQQAADAQAVELPYVLVAAVLIGLALLISCVRLPDVGPETRRGARAERARLSLWRHRNLTFGVPAIALYLVAEIGVGSTLVNFVSLPDIGDLNHAAAARYLSIFWGGAMAGRFVGAGLLRRMVPERLLAAASLGALALVTVAIATEGHVAMWSLIGIGLFHSIMFPTIFTLSIRGLGPLTEEGSGLLIMAIAGGALSAVQGVLADRIGLQWSYLLPAGCYLYVLFYALSGSRPTNALASERLTP